MFYICISCILKAIIDIGKTIKYETWKKLCLYNKIYVYNLTTNS